MTSPYTINNSANYAEAFDLLGSKAKVPAAFLYLLDLTPDARGSFKLVYYGSSIRKSFEDVGDYGLAEEIFEDDRIDESVYLLEIGSLKFKESREKLMPKLSKYTESSYRNRDNVIVPELVAETMVYEYDDGGNVEKTHYCLITRSRRCKTDLFDWFRKQREVDAIDLVSQFVDLFVVISDFMNDGLYFTDVKAENVINCGDHLAFIDLDSLLTLQNALRGRSGTLTSPAADEYMRLRKILTSDGSKTMKERAKSRMLFFRFYTLFAFSFMVLRYYWRTVSGENLRLDNIPTREELEKDLKHRFPRHVAGRHDGMKLLLLSRRTVEKIYLDDDFDRLKALKLLKDWTIFSNLVLKPMQRRGTIKERRRERIAAPRRGKRKRGDEEEGKRSSGSGLRIRVPPKRGLLF